MPPFLHRHSLSEKDTVFPHQICAVFASSSMERPQTHHFIMCPQSLIGSLESGHYSGPLRVILKNRYLWMLAAPLAWLCTSYRTRALIKPLRAIVPVKAAYKMSVRSYLHPYFLSAYLSTQNLRMTLNIHISPSNRRHETNINSTT